MAPFVSQKIKDWKQSLEAAKKYTSAQGEVVHAANLLQDAFFGVFRLALSMERSSGLTRLMSGNQALAIWHIVQNDGAQRDMALTAISTVPTELKLDRAVKALAWAKRKADRLAGYRNLIAHSPVMFRIALGKRRGFVPVFDRSRLDLIEGLGFWRLLRNDLLKLSAYVAEVIYQIQQIDEARGGVRRGSHFPWPRRPRLPSFARLVSFENQIEQAARLAKQGRRRLPSRR
jgi:hypothetical protein